MTKDIKEIYGFDGSVALEELDLSNCDSLLNVDGFENCINLKKVILPEEKSLFNIGIKCFKDCVSLEEINIPETVTEIDEEAFFNCKSLKNIELKKICKIGRSAFTNCNSLTNITISDNDDGIDIDDYAFYGCNELEYIKLPNGLKTISGNMLNSCNSLKRIVVPKSITWIKGGAFSNDLSYSLYYMGTEEDWENIKKMNSCGFNRKLNDGNYSSSLRDGVNIYYYSSTKPSSNASKYWHYVDDVPQLWE